MKTEVEREISLEMKGISKEMRLLLDEREDVDIDTKRTI